MSCFLDSQGSYRKILLSKKLALYMGDALLSDMGPASRRDQDANWVADATSLTQHKKQESLVPCHTGRQSTIPPQPLDVQVCKYTAPEPKSLLHETLGATLLQLQACLPSLSAVDAAACASAEMHGDLEICTTQAHSR